MKRVNFYLLFALTFLMSTSLFSQQKNYYLSGATGNDANDGSSWQKAFQSIDKVLEIVGGNNNSDGRTYNIYIAEGNYEIKKDNENRVFKGNKQINFIGGFPKPNQKTPPNYICSKSPILYPVSFDYAGNNSMFRIGAASGREEANSTDLTFENINYHNLVSNGGGADGTFLTVDATAHDSHVVMRNMAITAYKAARAAFIYYFGSNNSTFTADKLFVGGGLNAGAVNKAGGGFIRAYGTGTIENNRNKNLTFIIKNSTFTGNQLRDDDGGAVIDMAGYDLSYNNKIIVENSKFCNNVNSEDLTSNGVALRLRGVAEATIKNNRFEKNKSINGVVYVNNVVFKEPLSGNIWKDNLASYAGGALYITNSKFNIDRDTFINNSTGNIGGAIFVDGSKGPVIIKNSIFCKNKQTTTGNIGSYGGGALLISANEKITLENNIFNENSANFYGGAVRTNQVTSLKNNIFNKNQGYLGGALYSEFKIESNNNIYSENNAPKGEGGAIYYSNGLVSEGDEFTKNSALVGGALRARGLSFFKRSSFLSNKATNANEGGAIRGVDTGAIGDADAFYFEGSKSYGNLAAGVHTGVNGSEFSLPSIGSVRMYIGKNSKIQLATDKSHYPPGNGFILDGSNTRSDESTITATEIASEACGSEANVEVVCPTLPETLDPEAIITNDKGEFNKPNLNALYCHTEAKTASVTIFSATGKAPYTFTYRLIKINGVDGSKTIGDEMQVTTSEKSPQGYGYITLPIPVNVPEKGITYKYEVLKVVDADMKTVEYGNCSNSLSTLININPKPHVLAKAGNVDAVGEARKDDNYTANVGDEFVLFSEFVATETKTGTEGQWNDSSSVQSYKWTGPDGFKSTEQNPKLVATKSKSGEYTLTITDNNGCTSTDTVTVNINEFICEVEPNVDNTDVKSTHVGISTLNRNTEEWLSSNNQLGAYLVLESTAKGFVVPRFDTTAEIENNIGTSIAEGLEEGMVVWDNEANCLKMFFDKDNNGTMTWNCVSTDKCNNSKK